MDRVDEMMPPVLADSPGLGHLPALDQERVPGLALPTHQQMAAEPTLSRAAAPGVPPPGRGIQMFTSKHGAESSAKTY